MARIRTIKPEFPQSESIGKLSRDARLLFLMLFTIVDDAGRTRASSRMLASLLYPYDDDAREQMSSWLDELERNDHVRRYEVDGSQYLEVVKWLEHQKIDRPSPSRLPSYPGNSADAREDSRGLDADLVPSTLDLVPSTCADADAPRAKMGERKSRKGTATPLGDGFAIPAKVREFGEAQGLSNSEIAREHQRFCNHAKQNDRRCVDWEAAEKNWMIGAAERLGRSAPAPESGEQLAGFLAKFGSEELDAWDEYGRKTAGKTFPRNKEGGWRFPSQWPPGYKKPTMGITPAAAQHSSYDSKPDLKAMS